MEWLLFQFLTNGAAAAGGGDELERSRQPVWDTWEPLLRLRKATLRSNDQHAIGRAVAAKVKRTDARRGIVDVWLGGFVRVAIGNRGNGHLVVNLGRFVRPAKQVHVRWAVVAVLYAKHLDSVQTRALATFVEKTLNLCHSYRAVAELFRDPLGFLLGVGG